MDMIVNQDGKNPVYVLGEGKGADGLRINIGGLEEGLQLTFQSFHSFFMHIPGLTVVTPFDPL